MGRPSQMRVRLRNLVPASLRLKINAVLGRTTSYWVRTYMDQQVDAYVDRLAVESLDCLEISGQPSRWPQRRWKSYRGTDYPDYDICAGPLALESWDVVIAEQVLEHIVSPARAVAHVRQMLRSNGLFLVTTPFLMKYHPIPIDGWRWTELGLKQLLLEGGFAEVETGSWGNLDCVIANLTPDDEWVLYNRWPHSLKNDPYFPVSVWAFARKR